MALRWRPPQVKVIVIMVVLGGLILLFQGIGRVVANVWESPLGKIILIGIPVLLLFLWWRKRTQKYEKQITLNATTGPEVDISVHPVFQGYVPFINDAIQKYLSHINSVDDNTLQKISNFLFTAITCGWSSQMLAREIRETGKIDKEQSEFIARNGIRSVQTALNLKRSVDVGFEMYEWQTAEDDRVSAQCRAMNGKICRYEDDTVYSTNKGKTWKKRTAKMPKGKPGEKEDCRCDAIPYVDLD